MWSALWYRLTCKSSCKCFAAGYLSGDVGNVKQEFQCILHREKFTHLGWTHKHTFLSKLNGMECFFFTSNFLNNFLNWVSTWPHGQEHCTKHSSGHENSSTHLAFLHGNCDVRRWDVEILSSAWREVQMGGKWLLHLKPTRLSAVVRVRLWSPVGRFANLHFGWFFKINQIRSANSIFRWL